MKTVKRILILLLIKTTFDCIGSIAESVFNYPGLKIGCIGCGGIIIGYLYRGWWPPKEKEVTAE
ncbi:hypothetical protein PPK14_gp10 [Bacillus phage vB_BspS_SplendidRed]|uniref:Uncharacterized protein n=1 Tax=Bacillus phage vB_BspS_SplendidRed TaxID=2591379 RepID=A0A5B9NH06_9CAUD|nr:hypothetical protein PPK14_gp10 [Bacillus phage vB_BspS_SplendidRed]QEG13484.1 hypothetical protein SPLENDIDRED_10 [Bacillus phage vB_BspS_SplendidRed]